MLQRVAVQTRQYTRPVGVLGHGGVAVLVELGPAAHHPLGKLVPGCELLAQAGALLQQPLLHNLAL